MSEHPVLTFVRGKVADPSRPFTIIADLEAQRGRGDAVAEAIAASGAMALTRLESGCVTYDICRDVDAPDRFVAYECWRDLSALESHLATRHFATLSAALEGLLAGAPMVRILGSCGETRDERS